MRSARSNATTSSRTDPRPPTAEPLAGDEMEAEERSSGADEGGCACPKAKPLGPTADALVELPALGEPPAPGPELTAVSAARHPIAVSRAEELREQGAVDYRRYLTLLDKLRAPDATPESRREDLRAFVTEVEACGGFPIAGPEGLIFVYVSDSELDLPLDKLEHTHFAPDRRGEPIRVAGDFNGWSADGEPLVHEGEGFFHLQLPLTPEDEGWRYKLVAKSADGHDVWFSDPLSRRFLWDDLGRISLVRGSERAGHIEWVRAIHSEALGNARPVYFYLPPGYDQQRMECGTLLLHDGNDVFHPAQPNAPGASLRANEVADGLIRAGELRPFVIVAIPNTPDRRNEFTHCPEWRKDDSKDGEKVLIGGKGRQYAHFVMEQVLPMARARYSLSARPADTAILGTSLGGLISYLTALWYEEIGQVGSMSGTFGWGKDSHQPTAAKLYAESALAGRALRCFLYSGGRGKDDGVKGDIGKDNYVSTLGMRDELVKLGYRRFPKNPSAVPLPRDIDILHYWTPFAAHDQNAWRAELPRALRFFFGR